MHLLKTVWLPGESCGLFPLCPVGSLIRQGNLDIKDMPETWRKIQKMVNQSHKYFINKT